MLVRWLVSLNCVVYLLAISTAVLLFKVTRQEEKIDEILKTKVSCVK